GRRSADDGRGGAHTHEGDERVGRAVHVVVDDRDVELLLGGELDARRGEPALTLLRVLGAPADQAAHQLVEAGRGEEDEPGVQARGLDRLTHLARALEVDLQEHGNTGRELLLDGPAWRPVAV